MGEPARVTCGGGGDAEVRCGCGSLLARIVDGAVELKCRRCKHVWRIALEDGAGPRVGPARTAS